jgi:hypothetical protein
VFFRGLSLEDKHLCVCVCFFFCATRRLGDTGWDGRTDGFCLLCNTWLRLCQFFPLCDSGLFPSCYWTILKLLQWLYGSVLGSTCIAAALEFITVCVRSLPYIHGGVWAVTLCGSWLALMTLFMPFCARLHSSLRYVCSYCDTERLLTLCLDRLKINDLRTCTNSQNA